MLEKVKLSLRITTTAFDSELEGLIQSALLDLGLVGIDTKDDSLVNTAVITYVKLHFGECDNYDRLKASYDEQKAQLMLSSAYRTED